ncbi:MAG: anthranilate phosphoribosyltransferase [candidate division NC10 bacterium]|nr:anthranilate phosphoribosyltransferase [candidate division NC10 bacterium]
MIVEALQKVLAGHDLNRQEAYRVMEILMSGQATDAQTAAFLTAMRMKGETVEELCGFTHAMRERVTAIPTQYSGAQAISHPRQRLLVDTCGTGGDAKGTFNISTAAAFVVAGAGVPVAKHGNRSVSGLCGSADVIEALGIPLDLPPERVGRCIDEVGIGFLFAPLLHPAMKHVMPARRQIRIRTLFNLLGPLTNPARASAQVIGVYDGALTEVLASVLNQLGCRRAFVVYGMDGLDEISTTGETKISEVREGKVRTYFVRPEDFGLSRTTLADLKGGDASANAEVIRQILQGVTGPQRDIVVLNAGAAIVAGGGTQDIQEGIKAAKRSVESGTAWEKLEKVVAFCKQ